MKIDPNKTWRLVEERLSTETDPAVRHNLELVRDHMRAEAVADIEGVVATLCDTPEYVMHNNPDDTRTNPKGSKDAVRGFYDATIVQTGAHRLEFDCERVIADAHSVFTEGVMRMAYPGRTLAAMGIEVPVRGDSWAKFQFARSKLPYFYFALGLAFVAWLVTWKIEDSRWGYWWRAVKDNAEAAESLGVVVFRSKMAAAAVSAFLTAVGGGFYAQFVSYIDPESVMSFQFSLLMALPAVLGGIGTLWGPAVGAAILIPITEVTRSYAGGTGKGFDLIVYGLLVMGIALGRPEGIVGAFSARKRAKTA